MLFEFDLVIVGAGGAGLYAALEASKTARTAVISKLYPQRSHTGSGCSSGRRCSVYKPSSWRTRRSSCNVRAEVPASVERQRAVWLRPGERSHGVDRSSRVVTNETRGRRRPGNGWFGAISCFT